MAGLREKTDPKVRFWAKVHKGEGCWEWMAGRSSVGYGTIKVDGRQLWAHRFSYEINVGAIPPGLCVMHRCDNRGCVNPDHLMLGTKGDNNRDRAQKGRSGYKDQRGEKNPNVKLTWEIVRLMRQRRREGLTHKQIAVEFLVSKSSVGEVVSGHSWQEGDTDG